MELKPCPFCGANDAVETDMEGMRRTVYFVSCNKCGAAGPSRVYPDHSQPLTEADLWNRRATAAPEQSDRERAESYLFKFCRGYAHTVHPLYKERDSKDLAALLAAVRAEERERWAQMVYSRGDVTAKKAASRPHETEAHKEWLRMANEIYSIAAAIRKGEP